MTSLDDIVAEIRNGIDLEQSDRPSSPGMLPISRIETISEGVIDFSRVKYATPTPRERQKYQLQSGDILFSHINSPEHIGKTALFRSNKPLIHGINLLLLRVNHEACHPEYLNLYLKSFAVRARFRARCKKAVNQASLNQDDILSLDVPIPTLPEQKRIAAILENADWLRRTRRYARQLSDTFLQSVFLKIFGDPLSPRVADSIVRFEDILEVQPQNGLYVPREQYVSRDDRSGVEMVHMADLFDGIVATGNLKRVDISEPEKEKYALREDDLLIARRSINYEGAAKPCRIPILSAPLVFESSMIRVRPDKAKALPLYLYHYLSHESVRRHRVRRYVTISTISGINQDGLKRIEVVVPPLPLQQKFAAIAQRFERLRAQQREAERQADHLFQTLLHRAFNCEV